MAARPYVQNRTGDERSILIELLEWYRDGVVAKVTGLSDEDAARRFVSSSSTAIGLVNHLAYVEDWWFTINFAGQPDPEPWASADWDADEDWEFTTAPGQPLAEVLARYAEACDRSRAVLAGASLDDLGAKARQPFSCRWMLVHMIEETARHLGHLDILRELTDGDTGD